jgi:hypothetical protein
VAVVAAGRAGGAPDLGADPRRHDNVYTDCDGAKAHRVGPTDGVPGATRLPELALRSTFPCVLPPGQAFGVARLGSSLCVRGSSVAGPLEGVEPVREPQPPLHRGEALQAASARCVRRLPPR